MMKTVVLTGRFNLGGKFLVRKELQRLATERGIYVDDKVTYATDYLVTSYQENGESRAIQHGHLSKKQLAAMACDVPVMSAETFAAWLMTGEEPTL